MKKVLLISGLAAWVAFCSFGCGSVDDPDVTPMVLELSDDSVVVGETLFFVGKNFLEGGTKGHTILSFDGEFVGDDGSHHPAIFSFVPLYDGKLTQGDETFDVLRWSRFGPFDIPFTGVQTSGLFRGMIRAANVAADGTETPGGSASYFELRVDPSVVIKELQPLIAECGAPALRGLGGMPYKMKVKAIGFAPSKFRYTINNINGYEGETVFEHAAYGPEDELGWEEHFVLNPVPEDLMAYVTSIRVEALDDTGRGVETVLPLSIHRPIEFFNEGKLVDAEYYHPVPVSSCIPGTIANRTCYSESTSETRQQSVSITVSRNWMTTHGTTATEDWHEGYSEGITVSHSDTASLSETESASETYGVNFSHSESNSVGFTSTDGESWGWDMSEGTTDERSRERMDEVMAEASLSGTVTVNGEAGVPGLGKVGGSASTTAGVTAGAKSGWTDGERTESRRDQGYNAGGHHDESTSFGSTTTDSSGVSFSGTYSLSSTTGRSHTDTESRSMSRTYSFGGSVSETEMVSEGMSESEERTWVESSTHTTLMSYCGFIPVDRYGVFYRQTKRLVRKVYIRSYDLCGRSEIHSELTFNEWTWAPDLAIGDQCVPEPPPTNLPDAQCMLEPCSG